ncbi:MAG: hypothetical protein ABSH56_13910 [Bryobacteraceae bacterium]
MTNADVVNMAKSGVGEQTIILVIQKGKPKFDTSPEAVIELKKAGVSDRSLECDAKRVVAQREFSGED